MDMWVPLPCAGMVTMTITHTLARLTVTTARIGSQTESSSGLARGSMDSTVVTSMAGAITDEVSMAGVTTVGATTVVVVMAIAAADLGTKAFAVTVVSTAVAVSMVVVADLMAAVGFTAAVVDFIEVAGFTAAVAMAVVEATAAGIVNWQES